MGRRPKKPKGRVQRKKKLVAGPKNDPISSAARLFLYECPGGMDENKNRDKFLAAAKRYETEANQAVDLSNVINNVVRAAFFQGRDVGTRQNVKRGIRGPLAKADLAILRKLADSIAGETFDHLSDEHDDLDHSAILQECLSTRMERFEGEEDDPQLWELELDQFARDIVEYILEQATAVFKERIGGVVWKQLGLPKF